MPLVSADPGLAIAATAATQDTVTVTLVLEEQKLRVNVAEHASGLDRA